MGCTVYLLILFVGFNLKFFKLKEKNERQSKLFIIRSRKSSVRMNCLLFVLIKYSCLIFWTVQGHTTDIYLSTQVWIRWNRVEIENKILYLGKLHWSVDNKLLLCVSIMLLTVRDILEWWTRSFWTNTILILSNRYKYRQLERIKLH